MIVVENELVLSTDNPLIDGRLSSALGHDIEVVSLVDIPAGPIQTIRPTLILPSGSFHDDADVHMLTTGSVSWLSKLRGEPVDGRRFKPNLYIQTASATTDEDNWVGYHVRIGTAVFEISEATNRCAYPMLAQGDMPQDPELTRLIKRHHDDKLGVYAKVIEPGVVRVNDPVVRI